jgi:hypothetical protein
MLKGAFSSESGINSGSVLEMSMGPPGFTQKISEKSQDNIKTYGESLAQAGQFFRGLVRLEDL